MEIEILWLSELKKKLLDGKFDFLRYDLQDIFGQGKYLGQENGY